MPDLTALVALLQLALKDSTASEHEAETNRLLEHDALMKRIAERKRDGMSASGWPGADAGRERPVGLLGARPRRYTHSLGPRRAVRPTPSGGEGGYT